MPEIQEFPIDIEEFPAIEEFPNQPKQKMGVGKFITTPISKLVTGQSLVERMDLVKKSTEDISKVGTKKGLEGKPLTASEAFFRGLPAQTGEVLTSLIPTEWTPVDVGVTVATWGLGKIPALGTTVGEIATKIPMGKGFVQGAKELGRYTGWLKEMTPLSSRGVSGMAKEAIGATTGRKAINKGIVANLAGTTEERINLQSHADIASQAAQIAIENPNNPIVQDSSQRIFKRIASALGSGEIQPKDIPQIITKYNLSPQQFAELYVKDISTSAKELNVLSQLTKQIRQVLPKTAEVEAVMSKLGAEPETLFEMVCNVYKKVDNVRRASLVSQLATAMRNAISQSGRYALNIFDDAVAGVGEKMAGKSFKQSFAPFSEDLVAVLNRFSPTQRARVNNLLAQFPIEEARLISAPVMDVTLGNKYARFINTLNTSQEYFFRKMAFDAKIGAYLKRNGTKIPAIPEKAVNEAVNFALDMTFARTPGRGTAGNALLGLYNKFPFLTALGNPFPRFWVNSVKFLTDFSPGGYVRLLAPSFRKQLISTEPREAISALSKATLGSLMWGAGYALRNSPFAGEKWYEIKPDPINSPGKVIDTRAFAPFSTYLFIGEAVAHPERLSGTDWLQGAVGINRIAGTGLIIVDVVRSGTPEKTIAMVKEFIGQYTGGFSVPLRTLQDTMAQFNPEEAKVRSTKESPLTAPFIKNIPFASQTLPQTPSITRKGGWKTENPLLRQTTGLSIKTKSPIEQEIDRLNLGGLTPRTGDRKYDRLIMEQMGTMVEKIGNRFVLSEKYLKLPDDTKKDLLKSVFSQIKTGSKPKAIQEYLLDLKSPEEKLNFIKKQILKK